MCSIHTDGQGAMQVVLHSVVGAQGELDNDVHYSAIGGGGNSGKGESDESVAELVREDKLELKWPTRMGELLLGWLKMSVHTIQAGRGD